MPHGQPVLAHGTADGHRRQPEGGPQDGLRHLPAPLPADARQPHVGGGGGGGRRRGARAPADAAAHAGDADAAVLAGVLAATDVSAAAPSTSVSVGVEAEPVQRELGWISWE